MNYFNFLMFASSLMGVFRKQGLCDDYGDTIARDIADPVFVDDDLRQMYNYLDAKKGLGKLTMEDLTMAVVRNGANDDDLSSVQHFFVEADDNNDKQLTLHEFAHKLKYLDDEGKVLKQIRAGSGGSEGQTFLSYLSKLHPELHYEGSRKPHCHVGYYRTGEFCYKNLGLSSSYDEALKRCVAENADLPTFFELGEWRMLQEKMKVKGYLAEGSAIWLRLRRPGNEWLWQDTFSMSGTWTVDGVDGFTTSATSISCAAGRIVSESKKWKTFSEEDSSGFEDSVCSDRSDTLVVCQQHPEIKDVDVGVVNANITDDDLQSPEVVIRSGQIQAGRTKENLESMKVLLNQLNQKYQEQTSKAGKGSSVLTALNNDAFPNVRCLSDRIRNLQCAPQQGKRRRKKRKCSDKRRKRTTYNEQYLGWPLKPTIRYAFERKQWSWEKTQDLVKEVMEHWTNETCVDFVEDDTKPQVIIVRKKGCWSSIGRDMNQDGANSSSNKDTPQLLSIGPGCDRHHIIAHELGHLLGLDHEQGRSVRGEHVEILFDNIDEVALYNFDQCDECCSELEYTYDYGSIMHYSPKEFAKTKDVSTIIDLVDGRYSQTMGNTWYPSFYDVLQINKLLCRDQCKPEDSLNCVNGGYAHPRDCQKCLCPDGFGGDHCETINLPKAQCGGILLAGEEWAEISTPDYPESILKKGDRCHWILKAPVGMSVEIMVDNTTFWFPVDCRFGNIEVKFQADLAVTGAKYCGRQAPEHSIISETELMLVFVRLLEDIGRPTSAFRAEYRAVNGTDSMTSQLQEDHGDEDKEQNSNEEETNYDEDYETFQERYFDVAAEGEELVKTGMLPWPVSQTVYGNGESQDQEQQTKKSSASASASAEKAKTKLRRKRPMKRKRIKPVKPMLRDSSQEKQEEEDIIEEEAEVKSEQTELEETETSKGDGGSRSVESEEHDESPFNNNQQQQPLKEESIETMARDDSRESELRSGEPTGTEEKTGLINSD